MIPPLFAALHDDQLVHFAGDRHPVRTAALSALSRFGDAAVDPIIAEFRKGDVNEHVGLALAALTPAAREQAAPRLVAACIEAGRLTLEGLDALLNIGITDARLMDPILRPLFDQPLESSARHFDRLQRLLPGSSLTAGLLRAAIDASGYATESKSIGYQRFTNAVLHQSDEAVARLCHDQSSAATNVLHLVAHKADVSFATGRDGEELVSIGFGAQRAAAAAELERRGNPPYDVRAWVAGSGS